jgi:uncharacterized protein with HEPN domain
MAREEIRAKYGDRVVSDIEFIVTTLDEILMIVDRGKDALLNDVLLQRAVEGCANRIGDTISQKRIPLELQEEYGKQETWSAWIAWRIQLVHIYHRISLELLWSDMVRDVPEFRRFLIEDVLG